MTALDFAMEMAFTDPNLSRAAWYRDQAGQYREVRVVLRRPDESIAFGAGRFVGETVLADVRVCDVAEPLDGQTILIEEESFLIQGAPIRQSTRLVWRLELVPA